MVRKSMDGLGELQKEIMDAVWELEEATVREIQERINKKQKKNLAYTSILSIMQRLEKYGWLKHRKVGRTYYYQAKRNRSMETIRTIKDFVNRVFQGNKQLLFRHIIEDQDLSDEDLEALQQMIEQKRKGRK